MQATPIDLGSVKHSERSSQNKKCSHFKNGCPFRGSGCSLNAETTCFEAQRRTKVISAPCPIMVALDYDDKDSLKCSMPLCRALIPDGIPCHDGNNLCFTALINDKAVIKELKKKNPDYDLIRESIIQYLKKS